MEEVIQCLPESPITTDKAYELMQPPRMSGFVLPSFTTDDGCVGFYFEHEGEMKAIGYTGSAWEQVGPIHDNVDEIIHDEEISEMFVDSFYTALESTRGSDFKPVDFDVQHTAPVGFQFKMCVRHRALSSKDYHMLETYPQFADTEAIWGNPDDGIVGVCVDEMSLDPPSVAGIVFAYYNPDLGTWRIVDVIDMESGPNVGNQLHDETKRKLEQYYDDLDMICGPTPD